MIMKGLNEFADKIHQMNVEKGFYESERGVPEMIALLHSELSEALECDREARFAGAGDETWALLDGCADDMSYADAFRVTVKDTFEDEVADVFIRLLDLAGYLKIDLEKHVKYKMRYNATRRYKHGKLY